MKNKIIGVMGIIIFGTLMGIRPEFETVIVRSLVAAVAAVFLLVGIQSFASMRKSK